MVVNENEDTDFIENKIEEFANFAVRNDGNLEGKVEINVNQDDSFDIKLYKGTENKAQVFESVSKEQMLGMLEDNL